MDEKQYKEHMIPCLLITMFLNISVNILLDALM